MKCATRATHAYNGQYVVGYSERLRTRKGKYALAKELILVMDQVSFEAGQ